MLLGSFLVRSVLSFPVMRSTSANLIATRGAAPRVWLVAHTDSKSQTVGMLTRIASFAFGTGFYLILLLLVLRFRLGASVPAWMPGVVTGDQIIAMMVLAIVTLLPLTLCFITNRSTGALDNASGVAAVVLASEMVSPEKSFGVILTSGEELALAGAKAFLTNQGETGIAVNCDTIDDNGRFACMRSGKPSKAETAVVRATEQAGEQVRAAGIPGILTDSVAFAQAGWDTCTLSRGNLGTLARVHTSGDTAGRIDGTGIALAARILAATLEELA
jgi:hypothetical protein